MHPQFPGVMMWAIMGIFHTQSNKTTTNTHPSTVDSFSLLLSNVSDVANSTELVVSQSNFTVTLLDATELVPLRRGYELDNVLQNAAEDNNFTAPFQLTANYVPLYNASLPGQVLSNKHPFDRRLVGLIKVGTPGLDYRMLFDNNQWNESVLLSSPINFDGVKWYNFDKDSTTYSSTLSTKKIANNSGIFIQVDEKKEDINDIFWVSKVHSFRQNFAVLESEKENEKVVALLKVLPADGILSLTSAPKSKDSFPSFLNSSLAGMRDQVVTFHVMAASNFTNKEQSVSLSFGDYDPVHCNKGNWTVVDQVNKNYWAFSLHTLAFSFGKLLPNNSVVEVLESKTYKTVEVGLGNSTANSVETSKPSVKNSSVLTRTVVAGSLKQIDTLVDTPNGPVKTNIVWVKLPGHYAIQQTAAVVIAESLSRIPAEHLKFIASSLNAQKNTTSLENMLKAVSVLGFMRSYGKELLHSRPLSTTLYRCSSPAAAEGVQPSHPTAAEGVEQPAASSSANQPEESANTEQSNEANPETATENKVFKNKSKHLIGKAIAEEQQLITEGRKNVLEIALETNFRIPNTKQLLRMLASSEKTLTDKQMAALISIGGIRRGSSIVSVRRHFLTNLVNMLKEKGQKPGIFAMNALMAAKLDNDENVNVVEFLQQLANKGLELNNTSYELMARAYAKTGNVNAILSILSHVKNEENQDASNSLLNWLAYAEGMNGNVKNVYTIARASNTDDYRTSPSALYINAALGLAKKGQLDMVENILRRTIIHADNHLQTMKVLEIWMTLLSQNRLDALEKLTPYLKISQQTNCLPVMRNFQIVQYLDGFITSENFAAFEQVWSVLPNETKSTIKLEGFTSKQMLTYALKLMDKGKTEDYKKIIDAFRQAKTSPNSDDFFYYFIEEYFKRQNKPIDVVEAFSIYMKITQVDQEGEAKKNNFHKKTVTNLLRLALSTYNSAKAGDSQKHIYDIILDTIEQYSDKNSRNYFQQQVLTDIIGEKVYSIKTSSKEKKTSKNSESDVDKSKEKQRNRNLKKVRAEVINLLEPAAMN